MVRTQENHNKILMLMQNGAGLDVFKLQDLNDLSQVCNMFSDYYLDKYERLILKFYELGKRHGKYDVEIKNV